MSVTLGYLREGCQVVFSPDSSGPTYRVEENRAIQWGINRVWTDADWHSTQKTRVLENAAEDTGLGLLTPGSDVLTRSAGIWDSGVAGDAGTGNGPWEIVLEQQAGNTFFVIERISDTEVRLDHNFDPSASGPAVQFYALQNKLGFNSPHQLLAHQAPRQITLVWDTFQLREVGYLPPWRFEQVRGVNPTERSADPRFYTLRGNRLELWPHPGIARQYRATYLASPPQVFTSDPDTLLIDWQDDTMAQPVNTGREIIGMQWVDLLEKAIALEFAYIQGNSSPIKYELAKVEYEDRLRKYKAADNNRVSQTGPMDPALPKPVMYPGQRSVSDYRAIPDAGLP